jgi:large subunit ribosomal protein L10
LKKDEKSVIIDQLQELFSKSSVGILTNYRGLKTIDLLELRKKLKAVNGKYEITKNTLARFAAEKAGINQITGMLTETTAIAFGFGGISELAAAVSDFARNSKTPLAIKGGFLGNRLLSLQDIVILTTLPTKPVLWAA